MKHNELHLNKKTALFASILGSLVGFAGIGHGFLAASQGFENSNSVYLEKSGSFSVIPNYLITGIIAIIIGSFIIFWSIKYISSKNGPKIFIISSILMIVIGGGLAAIVYAPITFIVALKIKSRKEPKTATCLRSISDALAKKWALTLFISIASLFIGLTLLFICNASSGLYFVSVLMGGIILLLSFIAQYFTFITGYKIDRKAQSNIGKANVLI